MQPPEASANIFELTVDLCWPSLLRNEHFCHNWHHLMYLVTISNQFVVLVRLFACVFHPTREFFTRMETSPLPVKGCKF